MTDPYAEVCDDCGQDYCVCDTCEDCHGSGRVPVWDGYFQYMDDGCITCPTCGGDGRN